MTSLQCALAGVICFGSGNIMKSVGVKEFKMLTWPLRAIPVSLDLNFDFLGFLYYIHTTLSFFFFSFSLKGVETSFHVNFSL